MEECDGNRKCICTGGYTGAHCENTLPVEILRKKLNRKLSFVLILSMYVIIYQCTGCFQQPYIGASGAKPSSQLPISIHIQCTQSEYSSKVVGESHSNLPRSQSACELEVAHKAGAYPSFCSIKRLGEFLLPRRTFLQEYC